MKDYHTVKKGLYLLYRISCHANTLFLWLSAALIAVPPASKHFKLELLAPGVWAAIHNDNYGYAICNAGIIDLGDKTVVFDPFMTPEDHTARSYFF